MKQFLLFLVVFFMAATAQANSCSRTTYAGNWIIYGTGQNSGVPIRCNMILPSTGQAKSTSTCIIGSRSYPMTTSLTFYNNCHLTGSVVAGTRIYIDGWLSLDKQVMHGVGWDSTGASVFSGVKQ